MQVFINDRFVPAAEARLSLDDAGFVWGATVVERLRTFGGRTFRLDEHLRRFRHSCDGAMIPQPLSDERLHSIVREAITLHLDTAVEWAVVLLATPGVAGVPTLIVRATPFDFAHYRPLLQNGADLVTAPATLGVNSNIKHRSRLAWWIAQQQAGPGCDPLFVSPEGFVRETAAANFVAVVEGLLVTPPLTEVLGGIAINAIRASGERSGYRVIERELTCAEVLQTASECLLFCSSYGVARVASIDGKPIANSDGPVANAMMALYSALAGIDIPKQFRTNR